jgi:hypothetical protein
MMVGMDLKNLTGIMGTGMLLVGFFGFVGCIMSLAGVTEPKPGCAAAAAVLIPLGLLIVKASH